MRLRLSPIVAVGLVGSMLAIAPRVIAADTEIVANSEAFENREISEGAVSVSVSYTPYDFETVEEFTDNLSYQISYDGVPYLTDSQSTFYNGVVSLNDLDNDGNAEVIVETYSGGAHCCTTFLIYSWQGSDFAKTETGFLDGGGGVFEDIDGDGRAEFSTFDQSFLYAFSSYAGSFPPSLILSFQDGQFQDVTLNYTDQLRSTAWRMYENILQAEQQDYEINGVLAGYVAQKIRLGEYEEGWAFMLAHYDATTDWGLDIYDDQGNPVGQYPDYPTALASFLQELGYLDADGQPNPEVDRAPHAVDAVEP
ncbi:MAG: hypothetical protein IGR76_11440 [Synechococcales cyanobacterium T60_A2020_003]|nr:hypothetical protein [Synechococcales cyanobacterium T60_A2020_003]